MSSAAAQSSAAESFRDQVHAAAQVALAAGYHESVIDIAGRRVRVRSAGLDHDYFRALPGPAPVDGAVDLEVAVWSAEATGVDAPSPAWEDRDQLARGEIARLSAGGIRCAYNVDSQVLDLGDRRARRAYQCLRNLGDLPQYELGAPLRNLIAWWAEDLGLTLVHAAVVGNQHGGVLLVGRGGSGKSSTAAACAAAGMSHVSDDYCLAELEAGQLIAHRVFRSIKLTASETPHRRDLVGDAPVFDSMTGKVLAYVKSDVGTASMPIRAILIPRVTDAPHARLHPATPSKALRALAPSSLFQIPTLGQGALARMGALVRAVPAYDLALGTDRSSAPALVADFLASLAKDPA